MAFRKIFASKEQAMQEQLAKGFDVIRTKDGLFYHKSITGLENDEFYSQMVEYTVTESDPESIVKEKPTHCKIYRLISVANTNKDEAPIEHSYTSGLRSTLYPKRTFVKGELQKVEWFMDEAQTDLVLRSDITYVRDTVGFAAHRTTVRTWFREDGTEALPKKITEKDYTMDWIAQIEEGQRRRGNLIKGLQIPMVGFLMATVQANPGESELERSARVILLGRKFLTDNKLYFTGFIEDSNREILEVVQEATEFWMDNQIDANGTTIRQYLLSELDIGGIG